MRHLFVPATAALGIFGFTIAASGAAISGITVSPTRPTQNALVTWDVADSPDPDKSNGWMAWGRHVSRSDPGQSFKMPQTSLVAGFAVQLNSTLTNEPIVRNSSGDPISVALETYPNGTTASPDGTVGWPATPAVFSGNLPANFDDNATNYGHWVTFTFDAPVQLVAGNYYGIRLQFDTEDAVPPAEGGHDIKLNTGYWGDDGATSIDGRANSWVGGYQAYDANGWEDMQFVLLAPVPEPTGMALVGLAAAGLLHRRRR